jgi:hypothetical protein
MIMKNFRLNGLQDEVWSKFGVRLNLKKCADGYYQLGENIVNLKLDHEKGAIMSKTILNYNILKSECILTNRRI